MKTHLIIVDMQPNFLAARKEETIDNVIREIQLAKERDAHIFLVEFSGCGKTHKRIRKVLPLFSRKKTRVLKHNMGGGLEILDRAKKRSITLDRARVVGVNTDECVATTVAELAQARPDMHLELVEDACNSNNSRPSVFQDIFVSGNQPPNVSVWEAG